MGVVYVAARLLLNMQKMRPKNILTALSLAGTVGSFLWKAAKSEPENTDDEGEKNGVRWWREFSTLEKDGVEYPLDILRMVIDCPYIVNKVLNTEETSYSFCDTGLRIQKPIDIQSCDFTDGSETVIWRQYIVPAALVIVPDGVSVYGLDDVDQKKIGSRRQLEELEKKIAQLSLSTVAESAAPIHVIHIQQNGPDGIEAHSFAGMSSKRRPYEPMTLRDLRFRPQHVEIMRSVVC